MAQSSGSEGSSGGLVSYCFIRDTSDNLTILEDDFTSDHL